MSETVTKVTATCVGCNRDFTPIQAAEHERRAEHPGILFTLTSQRVAAVPKTGFGR